MADTLAQRHGGPRRVAPKYVDLARQLLDRIAEENLQPGDRLGTELELARANDVSRVTVRQALAMLEHDGYISRQKARGTFVTRGLDANDLKRSTHKTILLVCSNEQASHADEDLAFTTMLRRLEAALTENAYTVQILGVGQDERADAQRLSELRSRRDLAGICVIGPGLAGYRAVLPDVPILQCGGYPAANQPYVGPDIGAVCGDCVEHLIARGHRRIALVTGAWAGEVGTATYGRAFRAAFEAGDLPCPRDLLYQAYAGESLETLCRDMLSGPQRPTAVIAENWRVCGAVLEAAADLGLTIPRDLSVIGYGHNLLQLHTPIRLTAYRADMDEVARRAAQLIADADAAPLAGEPVLVKGCLLAGDSVAGRN